MNRNAVIVLAVVIAGFFLFSISGCGKTDGWWGAGSGGGQAGQEAAGPAGGAAPAVAPGAQPNAQPGPGQGPVPGAGPGAGVVPAAADDLDAGAAVDEAGVAPGAEPGAGVVPAAADGIDAGAAIDGAGIAADAGPAAGAGPAANAAGAEQEGDVRAHRVGFIPNSEERFVNTAKVGEAGFLYIEFINASDHRLNDIKYRLDVDNGLAKTGGASLDAGSTAKIEAREYSFPVAGEHHISLTVDPNNNIRDPDRHNNFMDNVIIIQEAGAEQPPPQQGLPELQAEGIEFIPFGSAEPAGRVPVGTRGWLRGMVKNAGRVDARDVIGYVRIGNEEPYWSTIPIVPAGFSNGYAHLIDLNSVGQHVMRLSVNPAPAIEESDSADDKNNVIENTILVENPAQMREGLPELQAMNIAFIPLGSDNPAGRVPVNTRGWLRGTVKNAGNVDARNVIGYIRIGNEEPYWFNMLLAPAGLSSGYAHLIDLNSVGQHVMRLSVNPAPAIEESDSADDRNNVIEQNIEVTGAVQSASYALSSPCNLAAEDIAFCPAPGNKPVSLAYVGESGHLSYTIRNKTGAVNGVTVNLAMMYKGTAKYSHQGKINIPASGVYTGTTSDITLASAGKYYMTVVADHPDNAEESKAAHANECTRVLDVRRATPRRAKPQDDYSARATYNTLINSFVQTGVRSGGGTAPAPASVPAAPSTSTYTPAASSTTPQKSITPATYKTRVPTLKK